MQPTETLLAKDHESFFSSSSCMWQAVSETLWLTSYHDTTGNPSWHVLAFQNSTERFTVFCYQVLQVIIKHCKCNHPHC